MVQTQMIDNVLLWEKGLEIDYKKRNSQPDNSYWDDLDRPHPIRELRVLLSGAIKERQSKRENKCTPYCYSGKYQETRLK